MKIEVENAQQNEQVDWTINPQLVISDTNRIILTTNEQNIFFSKDAFCGIEISNGKFGNSWAKEVFKPFHGKITLSND